MPQPTPAQLKTELTTDPTSLGYAGLSLSGIVSLINSAGSGSGTVDVETVTRDDVQAQVVVGEWQALSAIGREAWQTFLNMETIPIKSQTIRDWVTGIWGAGTTTRSNLAGLQTQGKSRAQELWGDDVIITAEEVREAYKS